MGCVLVRVPRTIYSEYYEELVRLLREQRIKKRVTQIELAERLDRPQSYVSKTEAGQRRLDVVELREWCDALGVDVVRIVRLWIRETS